MLTTREICKKLAVSRPTLYARAKTYKVVPKAKVETIKITRHMWRDEDVEALGKRRESPKKDVQKLDNR